MPRTGYALFPTYPLSKGDVGTGYLELAREFTRFSVMRIDGYVGVDWQTLRIGLHAAFEELRVEVNWIDVAEGWRSPPEISSLVEPYLGGDDPLFGTKYQGTLSDFLDTQAWAALKDVSATAMTVYYGCGAGLIDVQGAVAYVDLPKDELLRRSQQRQARNLGTNQTWSAKEQYKRFYFVDWPALNRHKAQLVESLDFIIDGQNAEQPTYMVGDRFRGALDSASRSAFRPRPWFAPGPWGGQWLKRHVQEVPQDEPNYAWSFELIAPENGVTFSDGTATLEFTFDWLLYHRRREILGECADRFGDEFPIRFDFLDTVDGGNLSLQCHPRTDYIRRHFGESFTQDETYYILDCQPNAQVYLGFREGIDPLQFRTALTESAELGVPVEVERFVAVHPAAKHDLFLIPNGTVHCSGAGNLVLEISATPYIFTFKMYDWLRADLDGKPRPLNIERAFANLDFSRQGEAVKRDLISRPDVLAEGESWRIVHLPTHTEHFYDVVRYEFDEEIEASTHGSPRVMMVVEGNGVLVETPHGPEQEFCYAETFVVPAAAETFRLRNVGPGRVKVVAAFIKKVACSPEGSSC